MIYVVGDGATSAKIGYTDSRETFAQRVETLRTGYPHALRVIYLGDGTMEQERALHRLLAAHRLNGEWFRWCADVMRLVDHLSSHGATKTLMNWSEHSIREPVVSGSRLMAISHFCKAHPAFSESAVRNLVHRGATNGLFKTGAVIKAGRKVIVDEPRFVEWVRANRLPA